ncbi:hypothetical protein E2542_SST05213 [Spatholobus suberectus]|nr:hypothetical protein E2542_SST05213 [Spatholobus suberectus]
MRFNFLPMEELNPTIKEELSVKDPIKRERVQNLGVKHQVLENVPEAKKMVEELVEEKDGDVKIIQCFQTLMIMEELQEGLVTRRRLGWGT